VGKMPQAFQSIAPACNMTSKSPPPPAPYLTVQSFDRSRLDGAGAPDTVGQWLAISNQVAYVIFSHGANGAGAWMPSGAQRIVTMASNRQDENIDADREYYTSAYDGSFDDLMIYETLEQIERYTVDYEEFTITQAECTNVYNTIALIDRAETQQMDLFFSDDGPDGDANPANDLGLNYFGEYTDANANIIDLLWHMQWFCQRLYPDATAVRCPGGQRTWSPAAFSTESETTPTDHQAILGANHGQCQCAGVWDPGTGTCI
jgi:hypothetical protein